MTLTTAPVLRRPQIAPKAARRRPRGRTLVLLLAGASAATWIPFVFRPPSSDEAGFLMVGSQWSPGTSLYGNYWVDRPPLLIAFFALAHLLGGVVALRILGLAIVAVSVLLAARVGALVSRGRTRSAAVPAAATAAVLLINPLFGSMEVNGELIALPLVLAGILCLLQSAHSPSTRAAVGWLVAVGALGAGAVLVKQNMIDVAVLLFATCATSIGSRHLNAWRRLLAAGLGATVMLVAVGAVAGTRGSSLPGLWDAVVRFRLQASTVIGSSASAATTIRLHHLGIAFLASGAPLILLAFAASFTRRRPGAALRWPVVVLLGWETFAIVAGGSYWLHYLIELVPGLVLAVSVAVTQHSRGRRYVAPALGYAVVASALSVGAVLVASSGGVPADVKVADYLLAHKAPGDTATVAFGRPDILELAHMSSPYSELWSLPVRVRDPDLTSLTAVLVGADRPNWLITGPSLQSWAIDADAAERAVARNYIQVADIGDRRIYHRRQS